MIHIQNLTVRYKRNIAINSLSLNIDSGEVVAIVGQNGAGKSSLINSIVGLIKYKGSINILGTIGLMPEMATPDENLSVYENLSFFSYLKGINKGEIPSEVDRIIELCEIEEYRNVLCRKLSKGFKQRVLLGCSIVGNPNIIILDEPSSGLDPLFQKQMIRLIKGLAIGKAVIISTHNVSEIEELATRVVVLKDGEMSFNGKLKDKRSYYDYF